MYHNKETDYWYDPNGNQISSLTIEQGIYDSDDGASIYLAGGGIGGDINSYSEYNSWNQLTKTMQNGKTASYTYNGDGLRMSRTVDGVTTSHIWDGTNIVGDVTNGTVTKYIRGLQLISSKKGSNESFYTYNGHGDVVQLTDGSGSITKKYSYDAFGVEYKKDSRDTNSFRYCGEYYDTETDSVYLRARYYRPTTGRFITEDPIMDGLNWYVYCGNNPIMLIDPYGLESESDKDEFGKRSAVYKRLVELGDAYRSTNDANLQKVYHAEAELIRNLERAKIEQGLQSIPGYYNSTVDAVDIIKQYNSEIVNTSHQFNMPKAMIASVLYRELMCYNFIDVLGDDLGSDTSRGLGQIKPSTAEAAERYYENEHPGEIYIYSVEELRAHLMDETTNIYFVGMVLWHCAKQVNVWVDLDYDYSNSASVLARYNGTGDAARQYGNETHAYLDPFIRYYWEVY